MIAVIQIGSGLANPVLGAPIMSPQVLIINEAIPADETVTFTFWNGVQATVPVGILRQAPVLVLSVDAVSGGLTVADLWLGKA